MAQEWYYTKDGDRQGPVTPQRLKQLAASGDLQPTDLIWKDGMAEWKPAKSLKGLFQMTSQPKATEPPPIAGHSKPTASAPSQNAATANEPTSVAPTDQPGPLKKAMAKFSSLQTPQKVLVCCAGGMGMFFFLCMGTCGLLGLTGTAQQSYRDAEKEIVERNRLPESIEGRWWQYTWKDKTREVRILIVDGTTMKVIEPNGESSTRTYTVKNDVEPKQIVIGLDPNREGKIHRVPKAPPGVSYLPGEFEGKVIYVASDTHYGIYVIERRDIGYPVEKQRPILLMRHEIRGKSQFRPMNFTDDITIGENYSLALEDGYVMEELWRAGDPPSH